jgi:hypothetical protein
MLFEIQITHSREESHSFHQHTIRLLEESAHQDKICREDKHRRKKDTNS